MISCQPESIFGMLINFYISYSLIFLYRTIILPLCLLALLFSILILFIILSPGPCTFHDKIHLYFYIAYFGKIWIWSNISTLLTYKIIYLLYIPVYWGECRKYSNILFSVQWEITLVWYKNRRFCFSWMVRVIKDEFMS